MKRGLVGEAPNDTRAIQNLLGRRYRHLSFVTLLNRINGSMLDNKKAINQLLSVEFEEQKPDIVIFIRDLDSHEKDKKKLQEREDIFIHSNRKVSNTGIFLLNIYEIEALILADISTFNKKYNCNIEMFEDVMKVPDPKGVLLKATRGTIDRFNVSHNPDLFKLLNFDTVKQNCRYFSTFIEKFDKALT